VTLHASGNGKAPGLTTKDSQAKRSLLNQVRDAEDHMDKIEAFATILKDAQNA